VRLDLETWLSAPPDAVWPYVSDATKMSLWSLAPIRRLDVMPRADSGVPLFSVWTCAREARGAFQHARIVMRDERGARTEESLTMRSFFGLEAAARR